MSKTVTSFKIIKTFKNWPIYFLDFFGLINKKSILYKLRNGIKLLVRPNSNDWGAMFEIWLYKFYTPKGFEIKKDDVIIDIGGHIGIFSIFASYYAKQGKIFSFEPMPENFELLKKNIELNKIKNVEIIEKAVSSRKGEKTLFISEQTGAHSFFQRAGGEKRKTKIEIKTISLSDFVQENNIQKIDFLKIDCEGAEYEILYHLSSEMLGIIEKISMEYHNIDDRNNVECLKKFLETNSFSVVIRQDKCNMLYASK